jgi:hypothetical protein
MISSLLTGSFILTTTETPPAEEVELTPGKENSVLGKGVQALTLNSPQAAIDSPVSSKQVRIAFEHENLDIIIYTNRMYIGTQ